MMIDVTDPPTGYTAAKGNGCDDDRQALQAMIDGNLSPLYFPHGLYRIDGTLVFRNRTGYYIIGCGMPQQAAQSLSGARAALVWGSSSTSDPMVRIEGTGLHWHGLALWGKHPQPSTCSPAVPTNGARAGIKIVRPSSGSPLHTGKLWIPAIYISGCQTGIWADGATGGLSADSCAFGYYWSHSCDTAVHLDGAGATMFTIRYLHPLSCDVVFKVTGGGRLYTHSLNILKMDTLLDISGSDVTRSFFHLNGLTMDANAREYHLLKNVDSGNGLAHVRITNAHFVNKHDEDDPNNILDNTVHVLIDRGGSTSGQTVLEIVGSRGLTRANHVLLEKVTIKGASATKPSRLIVRDCELLGTPATNALIDPDAMNPSTNYSEDRIKNWVFNDGLQANSSGP